MNVLSIITEAASTATRSRVLTDGAVADSSATAVKEPATETTPEIKATETLATYTPVSHASAGVRASRSSAFVRLERLAFIGA